jgi:hypothetical protein
MIIWNLTFWLALGETVAVLGTFWQTRAALLASIESMDGFFVARNQLFVDQRAEILARISRWRYLRRRAAVRRLGREIKGVLNDEELRLFRNFDRQTLGWSALFVAALIVCIVGWFEFRP